MNLIDSATKKVLCQDIELVAYGQFSCLTIAQEIPVGTKFDLTINGVRQFSPVASGAIFSQLTTITVDSILIDGLTMTLTGTGFPTSGHIAYASINGLEA